MKIILYFWLEMKKFPILYENSASFQCISVYCVGPSKLTVFNCFRDDTHMTLMNIVQFSRSLTPLSIYVQNSSTPLTLDVEFQTNPLPLQKIISQLKEKSIKRKHNPRMTIICYQILSSS